MITWVNEQARLLRAGELDRLDIEHLAEEIEDVGKSEQRELANRMAALLVHLLKWRYQPERRGKSWESRLGAQRLALARRLQKTPSLRIGLEDLDWWEDAWLDARTETAKETGIGFDVFPPVCPWTEAQVLDDNWPST